MANKETMIELELVASNGSVERKDMPVEHAQNLLRLSKQRGWDWRLPADSQYAYDETTGTIYRKSPKAVEEAAEAKAESKPAKKPARKPAKKN